MANITREIFSISSRPENHGGFSEIYTGIWSSPAYGRLKVAIKVVRVSPNDLMIDKVRRRLEKETRVWEGLSHANVQKLSGIYNGIGLLPALVSPWCDNGNIRTFVQRRASDPCVEPAELDKFKLNLLVGVMSGVQYLHDNHIVHGDIKGDNIIISDSGAPLLCDFGLSRIIAELSESSTQTGPRGTWRWMAPELCLVDGARQSYKSDVWACGCLFIEVWSSINPYNTKENQQQFFLALDAKEGPCLARPESMPDFVWARVYECCNFDASQRPPPSRISRSLVSQTVVWRSSIAVSAPADSVAWFPDGSRVAAGCADGSTSILDLITGMTLLRLLGHTHSVGHVAVSPNGKLIACCYSDKCIILWNAERGLAIGPPLVDHTDHVHSVAFSPEGSHLASGSADKTIHVWSTETCTTILGPLRGHSSDVNSVTYSPDGCRIVSGSADKTVRVWDAGTGDTVMTLRGHTADVRSVAYSPDSLRIISGSDDSTIQAWDALTGQLVGRPRKGHSDRVLSVAYSPDGTRIVSGSRDDTLRIWDAATYTSITTMRGHTGLVSSVAFSPDGKRVASASRDSTVRTWDVTENWSRWDI